VESIHTCRTFKFEMYSDQCAILLRDYVHLCTNYCRKQSLSILSSLKCYLWKKNPPRKRRIDRQPDENDQVNLSTILSNLSLVSTNTNTWKQVGNGRKLQVQSLKEIRKRTSPLHAGSKPFQCKTRYVSNAKLTEKWKLPNAICPWSMKNKTMRNTEKSQQVSSSPP